MCLGALQLGVLMDIPKVSFWFHWSLDCLMEIDATFLFPFFVVLVVHASFLYLGIFSL
jgi:hypothetical protein